MFEPLWTNGKVLIDEDTVWFVPSNYNCLCQYNYQVGEIVKFIYLEEATCAKGAYYNLLRYMDYIVLVPTRSMTVLIYDVQNGKIHSIPLKCGNNTREKFNAYAVWEHYIYMFPISYPQIIRLNMEDMTLEYINCESVNEYYKKGLFYTNNCVVTGMIANLLMIKSNKICEFDMTNNSERIVTVGNDRSCYNTMCLYKEKGFILSDHYGNIVILNEKKDIINYVPSDENTCFSDCIPMMEGYLFLPYEREKDCVYWDGKDRKKIHLDLEIKTDSWSERWKYMMYSSATCKENIIIFFHLLNRSLYILDPKTYMVREKYIRLNCLDDEIEKKVFDMYSRAGILNEGESIAVKLENLIKYMKSSDNEQFQAVNAGKVVYDILNK
ncbi:MAG: hypothetical protein HFI13_09640 [Lachnospiraceae bacterium]|nr:hypothetical protein [Lachnospiraceae bacterium]